MSVPPPALAPSPGERGVASWDPSDLSSVVLPAWDDFISLAAAVDLDAPSRITGWTARDLCVHLGSWPGSRSLERMQQEAENDDAAGDFDQDAHNQAVLTAWGRAPRADVLGALGESRAEVAAFLSGADAVRLGVRPVRSVLGPLPLSTLVGAGAFELAVHALDMAPAGARAPSAALLSAGLAALVDTTGALAARCDIEGGAGCVSPQGGWAFGAQRGHWTTLELPQVPAEWAVVEGDAVDLLDASAGRRAVPTMLARRDLKVHHLAGLMALAPIVEAVPGLPGGAALRLAVRNLRGVGRLLRRLPGF